MSGNGRSPIDQALQFMRANDQYPATGKGSHHGPSGGWRYRLADGNDYYLGADARRLLRPGYPKFVEGVS